MSTNTAKPGESAHTLPAAAGSHAPEQTAREMLVLIGDVTEFHGTRAQLEAEGVIPVGTAWPVRLGWEGWEAGLLGFWLFRPMPKAKDRKNKCFDYDWWCVRMYVLNRPSSGVRAIQRKAAELAAEVYRQSERGKAEEFALRAKYSAAKSDKQFKAFKALIPGLIPPKRKPKSQAAPGQ
jgi:hypothetical protein